MTLEAIKSDEAFILEDVSWDFYQRTLKELEESNQNVRVTYDQGRMEFMSPSYRHERIKGIIRQLIETYASALNIPIIPVGSVTCRRADLKKGLEADECYYIATPAPPADADLDLSIHAPPDLAIEVEISRRSLPKQPIYAALGVAEIWRFDGQTLTALHRKDDGSYEESPRSLAFPDLEVRTLQSFIAMALEGKQHQAVEEFRRSIKRL